MQQKGQKVYTTQFWLLCASSTLFFASFNMIIPELPDYLTRLGGEDYKGLFISLFTLTAGLSRPFSGKLADKVGRIPVMIIGSVVCVICGLLYPVLSTVLGFLLLRFFHGFSTGFKPTGTTSYVADIVPTHRRGEAMGVIAFCGTFGMALGPAIGSEIAAQFSTIVMFYCSSVLALFSVLVLIGMKETLQNRHQPSLSLLKISKDDVYEPRVLAPAIVMMFAVFSFGMILTIIPDFSVHLGIKNKGLFYTYFTVASLLIRFLAGKASDRFGREVVLKISSFTMVIAMTFLGLVDSYAGFIIGAVLFGIATGMNSPIIFAWTIDLSHEKHRGRAMATVYIALEIGIGCGAFFSALILNNDPSRFTITFWTGALMSLIAFSYLVYHTRSKRHLINS
ncbi:MFS transporter [Fulvivirgaceae bacterium BMA10]|uniref:MFS transporter n=1 Tax=Splendidivirga corallicola TaxID=3051826 RepID=A0ABT8KL50_9BACT|nr:MFS transporter [Fulvivirgaceae bacterium BMA10]